jgi:predicted nucleic acid-binding protein
MTERIVVDTSVLIDYLRQQNKAGTVFHQVFTNKTYQACIALVTMTELWAGKSMANIETETRVSELIKHCEVLFPNEQIAQSAGRLLRESNYEMDFADAEIAATSVVEMLPLLTLNVKHFRAIKELRLFDGVT